jgi:pimeloyl-ACP methyl ester carboxylesterase
MWRKIAKITMFTLLGLLGVVILLAALGLGFRAYRQHENAKILAIHTPNGIQEGMYVPIGGIEQWIQIRGENRNNPVLLVVHGGPGASSWPMSAGWQPWEKYFTVVQWDQRGTGRTYRQTGSSIAPTMTVDQMAQDGIEVAEFLRTHLHKEKVILVGGSWGSFLGIHMVKKRPDLFFAYVGTGQLIGLPTLKKVYEIQNTRLLALARATNNSNATKELSAIGAVLDENDFKIIQKWSRLLKVPFERDEHLDIKLKIPPQMMPGFTLLDWYYCVKGARFSQRILYGPTSRADLRSLGLDFAVPIFFFEGTADRSTPIEPAEQYFNEITAPHKEFVRFEGAHHHLQFNRSDDFLKELLARVRPLADPPKDDSSENRGTPGFTPHP